MAKETTPKVVALVAGGMAGLAVDVSLFPLDTIKTRLQSTSGFFKSGGFKNVYLGITSSALGSFPTASLFFVSYETTKHIGHHYVPQRSIVHMAAACIGEMAGCIVRVPFEVVKQRAQAIKGLNSHTALLMTLREEGVMGLYRGYLNTVARDIPFSMIQFSCWEYFKAQVEDYQSAPARPWQSALCGSLSAAFAGAITTPLDVLKSRIMLAEKNAAILDSTFLKAIVMIGRQDGLKSLFSGLTPRVAWLSIGGLIFLGTYEVIKQSLMNVRKGPFLHDGSEVSP